MNCILRGVRVIDPLGGVNAVDRDVLLRDGIVAAISNRVESASAVVVDLTPPAGASPAILCPAFIDLHAHLREPGSAAETVRTGAHAAAAGGFVDVVAMANTDPVIDTAEHVARARRRAAQARVRVHTVAALTLGLEGHQLVDIAACAEAGAIAFSDDGRNGASTEMLAAGLRIAARCGRPVLVHPEDERLLAFANGVARADTRCPDRPGVVEVCAVNNALGALEAARSGRLHLQHLSTLGAVELVRRAREAGSRVTSEVTPHHLSMRVAPEGEAPSALSKVNPPLRSESDRVAVVEALRDGTIDAIATDHAPHPPQAKATAYEDAAPGMIGLETALATCISLGGMGGPWLGVLVERLTVGPWRVLGGSESGIPAPRLQVGAPATCVLFDPEAEWVVGAQKLRSRSRNTPLLGGRLRGRVLLTMLDGAVVHHDRRRLRLTPDPREPEAELQGTLPLATPPGARR